MIYQVYGPWDTTVKSDRTEIFFPGDEIPSIEVYGEDHKELGAAVCALPELIDALRAGRKALAFAVIAHSGGLFDETSVGEHYTIAQIDAALAKTGH